jgi:hypothetical protein
MTRGDPLPSPFLYYVMSRRSDPFSARWPQKPSSEDCQASR